MKKIEPFRFALLWCVTFALVVNGCSPGDAPDSANTRSAAVASPSEVESPQGRPSTSPLASNANAAVNRDPNSNSSPGDNQAKTTVPKLYKDLNHAEKIEFLKKRARHIATLLGGEPYEFDNEIIEMLAKDYVDPYQRRVGNRQTVIWGDDLNYLFNRAQCYAPEIIRAFRRNNVPAAVGLYIVAVETEFRNIPTSNRAGAAGLFQFISSTAELYGVAPRDRTQVKKMADAAARYMSNRISEFGTDSTSVELAIAGYNRSPDSVRRDLQEVLNLVGPDKARSFWNLVAHSTVLDRNFRGENIKYVPKFIAIAIIGETPWAFDLQMKQALSSNVSRSSQCKNADL